MQKTSIACLVFVVLWAPATYAGLTTYYCGAGHQYINIGDSVAKIEAACGKADSVEPYKPGQAQNQNQDIANQDQIWTYQAVVNPMQTVNTSLYYTNPNNPLRDGMNSANPYGSNNSYTNTYNSPTFTVTVKGGQVTSVQGANHNCGNWNPYPGVSSKAVLNHCGQPLAIHPTNAFVNPYTTKIETWVYNNPYGPALKLQLTNGKLTNIELATSP